MDAPKLTPLQVGDRVGDYEVIATESFGPLPRAVIRRGVNKGIVVILTSPWKEGRS